MLAIRLLAMRESLERLGRYDEARSRARMERSFYPQFSEFIMIEGNRVGFYTFRPSDDGFHLEHLYLLPGHNGKGIGSSVLRRLTDRADAAGQPIFLGALKQSPANRFYERHGFRRDAEGEWDIYYARPPAAS
jgi:GNAT superfamily N-acetyltransferase